MEPIEQTLVLIKPDALKNSLTGYVLSQLSEFHTGLRFAAAKIVCVNRMLAEEHYAEHQGKVFFVSLIEYICGALHYPSDPSKRRVIALVYQGPNAIATIRGIAGPTNPHIARDTKPGTVRALGTVVPILDEVGARLGERMDNLIHASANNDDAEREIKLWFRPGDIPPLMRVYPTAVSDATYYMNNGNLSNSYEANSICLLAKGETAWESDLKALQSLASGAKAPCTLGTVAAKYLINEARVSE